MYWILKEAVTSATREQDHKKIKRLKIPLFLKGRSQNFLFLMVNCWSIEAMNRESWGMFSLTTLCCSFWIERHISSKQRAMVCNWLWETFCLLRFLLHRVFNVAPFLLKYMLHFVRAEFSWWKICSSCFQWRHSDVKVMLLALSKNYRLF